MAFLGRVLETILLAETALAQAGNEI